MRDSANQRRLPESNRWKVPEEARSAKNTHRWPRATTSDERWGPLCECGALKTDQALSCVSCAVERRRAPDYWEIRTCNRCGGPKSRRAGICRRCRNELQIGLAVSTGRLQPEDHPWRKRAA